MDGILKVRPLGVSARVPDQQAPHHVMQSVVSSAEDCELLSRRTDLVHNSVVDNLFEPARGTKDTNSFTIVAPMVMARVRQSVVAVSLWKSPMLTSMPNSLQATVSWTTLIIPTTRRRLTELRAD